MSCNFVVYNVQYIYTVYYTYSSPWAEMLKICLTQPLKRPLIKLLCSSLLHFCKTFFYKMKIWPFIYQPPKWKHLLKIFKYRYFKYNMTFTSVILISVHFKKRRRSAVKKFYTQRTVKYLPVPTVHNKFFFNENRWKSYDFINI